ncbi:MAG: hypothetical protein ACYDGN_14015 [Acidimicrobiales bacterium]
MTEEVRAVGEGDSLTTDEIVAVDDLCERVARLQSELARLRDVVRTNRLVVVDEEDRERLVAEINDGVLELRLQLPSGGAGQRTELLAFTTPPRDVLAPGLGMQLWANGNLVKEFCWWDDQA